MTLETKNTIPLKPFYIKPPWNILFDFYKLEKLIPWDVNISYLLNTFFEEMEKYGYTDFRASGVALGSSALIYLMKTKILLKLEEPPEINDPPEKFLSPPLFLPLRNELTSTTIKSLLKVLDNVLKSEGASIFETSIAKPILPEPSEIMPQIDKYLMEIELKMEELYKDLLEGVKGTGIIEFSRLIINKEKIEAIRTFILLLFLAQNGKISLWQNIETETIYIAIGEANFGKQRETNN